jgi:hypothetical protein
MADKAPKKVAYRLAVPAEETRDSIVLLRVTPSERAVFERLAKKDARSLSAWCRLACLERARGEGEKV